MHPCFLSAAPGRGRRIRGRSLGKSDEKKDGGNGTFRLCCNHYTEKGTQSHLPSDFQDREGPCISTIGHGFKGSGTFRGLKGWIREKLAQMPAIPCYTYDSGEKHFFLGREYPIVYERGPVSFVSVKEGKLCLTISPRTKDRPRAYRNLMKEELRKVIETYIEIWAPRMGVQPSSLTIRILKSRWGSCNVRTGELSFALDLITKPGECIESVVVHELNHLLETGHTRRFHALMARWLPDYKERTKKLYDYPREFI